MGRIFRVLCGFVIACLVAGLATVLFAYSPAELSTMHPEIAGDRLALAMPIATHVAIFSAPFALVAIALGEWQHWRDWIYYALAAIAIAMVGYLAQYQSETATQGWSIANNTYPLIAFLTTGFLAGLAYWLFSGRLAGHHLLSAHGRHGLGGHSHAPAKPAAPGSTNRNGSNKVH